jgi:hypothetical protein
MQESGDKNSCSYGAGDLRRGPGPFILLRRGEIASHPFRQDRGMDGARCALICEEEVS